MVRTPNRAFIVVALLAVTACSKNESDIAADVVRITPAALKPGVAAESVLLDRDTTTRLSVGGTLELTAELRNPIAPAFAKVFATKALAATIAGQEAALEPGWNTVPLRGLPLLALGFRFVSSDASAEVAEIELWGTSQLLPAPSDPRLTVGATKNVARVPYENVLLVEGTQTAFDLFPPGDETGRSCQSVSFSYSAPLRSIRRAYLSYDARGVFRSYSLERRHNGEMPIGGIWLGAASSTRAFIDELDPERLSGHDAIELCMPKAATAIVHVTQLRLVLVFDDGRHPADRLTELKLLPLEPGGDRALMALGSDTAELHFDHASALDSAAVHVAQPQVEASLSLRHDSTWSSAGDVTLTAGWNSLSSAEAVSALRLSPKGAPRADAPWLTLQSIELRGSPVGGRIADARIHFSAPTVRWTKGKLVGERFANKAYVAGWTESPKGPAVRVLVDGVDIPSFGPQFAAPIERSRSAEGTWPIRVRAVFADGSEVTQQLSLDEDREEELLRDGATNGQVASSDARFGRENETAWGIVTPAAGGTVRLGADVAFEAPAGAVGVDTRIGITRKSADAVPELEAGMLNVTAPNSAAYRFQPPGQTFLKPVRIHLPYDEALLPAGVSASEVRTFYYDATEKRWRVLPRVGQGLASSTVISETTHFTFMINAVLVMPEHPGTVSFNPTSIKDLKAADPAEGMDFIAAPTVGNDGTARTSFPIRLPKARGAYQPSVTLTYDSSASNGLLGAGWSVSTSSIAVDTRYGTPVYGQNEIYVLDGRMLIADPASSSAQCEGSGAAKVFVERVASSFARIHRCGADPTAYWWEVTDTRGVLFVYGANNTARLTSHRDRNVAEWFLERVVDTRGNATLYQYATDSKGASTVDAGFAGASKEDWQWVYPATILYTATVSTSDRANGTPTTAPYAVHFRREQNAQTFSFIERPDVVTSARPGFKTAMRFRLASIDVELRAGADQGTIRQYRFSYAQEHTGGTTPFGRSLLTNIAVHGAAGADGGTSLFYAHDLDYYRSTQADRAFTAPQTWTLGRTDPFSGSEAFEYSTKIGAYAGIGPAVPERLLSAGFSVSHGFGGRDYRSVFADINGDGLPDRITEDGILLNASGISGARQFTDTAPLGDLAAGSALTLDQQAQLLGADVVWSWDLGAEINFGPANARTGFGWSHSESKRILLDADGDGLLDLVMPNQVLYGRPRKASCASTDSSCCPLNRICFKPGKLQAIELSSAALQSSAAYMRDQATQREHSSITEPLYRWDAPFAGNIKVSARARRLRAGSGGDGIHIEVYGFKPSVPLATALLGRITINAGDTAEKTLGPITSVSTPLGTIPLSAEAGDQVYFKVSSNSDATIDENGSQRLPRDEILFEPEIEYVSYAGGDGGIDTTQTDALNKKLVHKYVHKDDFRLGGSQVTGTTLARQSRIEIAGAVAKQLTAASVRTCVQEFAPGTSPSARACAPADHYFKAFGPNAGTDAPSPVTLTAAAGTTYVFRIESDLPMDPAELTWAPTITTKQVCDGDGGCRDVTADEDDRLTVAAVPYYANGSWQFVAPPLRYTVPNLGCIAPVFDLTSNLGGSARFVVTRGGTPVVSGGAGPQVINNVQVAPGQQLFFWAHSDSPLPISPPWSVSLKCTKRVGDGGFTTASETVPADRLNFTYSPAPTNFARGFRGWSYGGWNSAMGPFNANATSDPGIELDEDDEEERKTQITNAMNDPDAASAFKKNRKSFVPLYPARTGVALHTGPLLATADGVTWIGADSSHAGLVDAAAAGGDQPLAGLSISGAVRASASTTALVGAGFGNLSGSVQFGSSESPTDLVDFNGDGLIDTFANGSMTISAADGGTAGSYLYGATSVREVHNLGLTAGLSLTSAALMLQPNAKTSPNPAAAVEAVSIMGSHAISYTRDTTLKDLLDVNGDGLPDKVERVPGANIMKVWLGMGTGFAAAADEIPVASWSTSYDGVLSSDLPVINEIPVQFTSAIQTDVLRRGASASLINNWGAKLPGSPVGGSAAFTSTISHNGIDVMDVNGDGLPDLVKKGFNDVNLLVQLNLGYGFAPEEAWTMPPWGNDGPHFRLSSVPAAISRTFDETGLPAVALKALGADGTSLIERPVDSLSISSSVSDPLAWNVSVQHGFPIPVPPIAFVFQGNVGQSYARSGWELSLQDLNGDGAPDHIFKDMDHQTSVLARRNKFADSKSGLLKSVSRPLGGGIEVEYARAGSTVAMPMQRWVASKVVTRDGRGGTGASVVNGHDFVTVYAYEGGNYDRNEKEFLGFARVTETRGPGGVGGDGSRIERTFNVTDHALKGRGLTEKLLDASNKSFSETTNTFVVTATVDGGAGCTARLPNSLARTGEACKGRFAELRKVQRTLSEGGATSKSTHTAFTYDAYGNVATFEDVGDEGTGDDVLATIIYSPALTTKHLVSLPKTVTVRDRANNLLRERSATYTPFGELESFTARIDSTSTATSDLLWNEQGMLESVEAPPNHAGQRYKVRYKYDELTGTYLRGAADSHGLESAIQTDPKLGVPLMTTDVAGNLVIQRYDAFGRLETVTGPYDKESAPTLRIDYFPGATNPYAVTRHKMAQGGRASLETVVFSDGLGRAIQTKVRSAVNGRTGFTVSGAVGYDRMGRVASQDQSIFLVTNRGEAEVEGELITDEAGRPTLTEYDVLGRPTRVSEPNGAITSFAYGFGTPEGLPTPRVYFSTTVTDALLNVRVAYRDIGDRAIASEERIDGRKPTTRYEYNALGEMVGVFDAAGNATRMTYDLLGRRTSIDNPDSGKVALEFDLAGNLRSKSDANLRAISDTTAIVFNYHFNRLVKINHPSSDPVTYTYGGAGAPENGAGRVIAVSDAAGTETRGYGRLGELVRQTRTIKPLWPQDIQQTYTTKFSFDSWGRALSIEYPDGEVVTYGYDSGGRLKSATGVRTLDDGTTQTEQYLRRLEYDEHGSRTFVELGNGVVSSFSYDPKTLRLKTLNTKAPTDRVLQALSYDYDLLGNVKTVTNALGAPANGDSGAVSFSYGYDSLYRLTSASGAARPRLGKLDRFSSSFEYSDIHNMKRNVQVRELVDTLSLDVNIEKPAHSQHDWAYQYEGTAPHQATRIGDVALTYDANGNTLTECKSPDGTPCTGQSSSKAQLRRFVWNDTNTLKAVIDGNGRSDTRFIYDAGGDRVVKLGRGGESVTVGQFFSVKARRIATKHIFAGQTRLASKILLPPKEVRASGGTGSAVEGIEPGCVSSEYQPNKCEAATVFPNPSGGGAGGSFKPATYYFHADHLGSTHWLTNQEGEVHEHVEYYPYGEVWRETRGDKDRGGSKLQQAFQYTGKEFDEETGLTYFGARYYDSKKARWTAVDPADSRRNAVALNVYQYGLWNPVRFHDPDGAAEGDSVDDQRKRIMAQQDLAAGRLSRWNPRGSAQRALEDQTSFGAQWNRSLEKPTTRVLGGELTVMENVDEAAARQQRIKIEEAIQGTDAAAHATLHVSVEMLKAEAGGRLVAAGLSGVGARVASDLAAAKGIKFGQSSVGNTFAHGPFKGKTIGEVADGLKSGKISPDQLPLDVVVRNGETITLNNRSLTALRRAGVEPTRVTNRTGDPFFEGLVDSHLGGTAPSDVIRIRGGAPNASFLE